MNEFTTEHQLRRSPSLSFLFMMLYILSFLVKYSKMFSVLITVIMLLCLGYNVIRADVPTLPHGHSSGAVDPIAFIVQVASESAAPSLSDTFI